MEVLSLLNKLSSSKEDGADGFVFWLHYRLSATLLLAASLIFTAGQYFGDPISCTADAVASKIMNSYCWVQSTFTVKALEDGVPGRDVVQPGVGPHDSELDEVRHQSYYQFVWLALVVQAGLMYLPHFLWKILNLGAARRLAELCTKEDDSALSFVKFENLAPAMYTGFFVGCEALNLGLVASQLFAVDLFLGGGFLHLEHGLERVFPKVTKCILYTVGPSGTPQRHDSVCLLPFNVYAQKIYFALWFWYWALVALSAANLLFRVATAAAPPLRALVLMVLCHFHCDLKTTRTVSKGIAFHKWFVLCALSRHVDVDTYVQLVEKLAEVLTCRND